MIVGFFLAASIYENRRAERLAAIEEASPVENEFVRVYSQRLGPPDAKVVLVEFLDPGCESCAALSPFVKEIVDAHAGRVQLVIRYIPLHQGADVAVRILEAARKQGKYWETLQMMFDTQSEWASHHHPAPQKLGPYLPALGLDMERLRLDMAGMEITHILQQDMADAQVLGVRRTPTFFVNGKALPRFGLNELQALVASEVAANY
ncbi:MAG: thioredoxin domain-containing protein [Acidobacteria bacterium]|nr:thioredoxin domain-containing protein [Acidobacteriota bacterium]NIM63648.1 thioredoxin domain-containing protein [Acidobacteriota bacterium]NIO59259.1 thioredoxin domain-containing protein [Acidobacteriota bacterium]NIQ85214.1 thioredoxin domain-containing protein [Acidobacteriota bacterium]NIT10969.1 thioredoxin domain-containing protein [Acidobacteriota bacterium]